MRRMGAANRRWRFRCLRFLHLLQFPVSQWSRLLSGAEVIIISQLTDLPGILHVHDFYGESVVPRHSTSSICSIKYPLLTPFHFLLSRSTPYQAFHSPKAHLPKSFSTSTSTPIYIYLSLSQQSNHQKHVLRNPKQLLQLRPHLANNRKHERLHVRKQRGCSKCLRDGRL